MRVGFIGCDETAVALARGWGEAVLCADGDPARAIAMAASIGGDALLSYEAVAERAELVVLCHEPGKLREIADAIAPYAGVLVSTLPDTPLGALRDAYPGRPVYRVAVNPPVQIGRGIVVLAKRPAQAADDAVRRLFDRLGSVLEIDDALVDPAARLLSDTAQAVEAIRRRGGRSGLDELLTFLTE